jgi:hypothetical protein
MRGACGTFPNRPVFAAIATFICLPVLFACSSIQGYPYDPEDTAATLQRLNQYFDGSVEANYLSTPDDTTRTQLRNLIIYGRMRAYDIEFANFERALYSQGNSISVGSDFIALILAGLTATTGNAATKAALGAASAGVLGANAAINKDLYYQKTIVALLAQMEANRAQAKVPIARGLSLPDSQYNLFQAYSDLDTYKNAGSIPGAISGITQSAEAQKQGAQVILTGLTLETPPVRARLATLAKYIQSLVVKKDTETLTKIAGALNIPVPSGSTYLQIKASIVEYIDMTVNTKMTEADKLKALDSLAATLRPYVSF